MAITIEGPPVAKTKGGAGRPPKRYGTLIRVSEEFAQAVRDAASFDRVSIAEFATLHLLPVAQRHYREAVLRKAKKMEGGK